MKKVLYVHEVYIDHSVDLSIKHAHAWNWLRVSLIKNVKYFLAIGGILLIILGSTFMEYKNSNPANELQMTIETAIGALLAVLGFIVAILAIFKIIGADKTSPLYFR